MKNQDSSSHFLLDQAKRTETSPGIYCMKDASHQILYVGKAKNLRNRLLSYFQPAQHPHPRIALLLKQVSTFEVILTETESEALLLEATWIKKYHPSFNIQLKDDKTYPYLKIQIPSPEKPFPRIEWTRRILYDGSRYFGPFPSSTEARQLIQLLNQSFQLRDCSDNTFRHRSRPCILYQMNHCSAPCVKRISSEDYQNQVNQVILLLEGKNQAWLDQLQFKMNQASEREAFEQAALYRDQLQLLQKLTQIQSMDQAGSQRNQDVFGIESSDQGTQGTVLCIRKGKLISVRQWILQNTAPDFSKAEILNEFLAQYYWELSKKQEPEMKEVLISELPLEKELLEKTFFLEIHLPESALDHQLLAVAQKNAVSGLERHQRPIPPPTGILEALQKKFELRNLPVRMECYDISNLQDQSPVASRVVFIRGIPDKKLYRRYRLKTTGPNDFAMMREVLSRRLENTEEALPDLIIVDGGKGQLAQAIFILEEKNIHGIDVLGLAKARSQKESEERIFRPHHPLPTPLSLHKPEDRLLVQIRDEAHRFALGYHRVLRSKSRQPELRRR